MWFDSLLSKTLDYFFWNFESFLIAFEIFNILNVLKRFYKFYSFLVPNAFARVQDLGKSPGLKEKVFDL